MNGINLSGIGAGFTNSSNARVIGIYGGSAPGWAWGGGEVQVLFAYDQQSGQTSVYLYTGGTLGPSIGANGESGVFPFDGPIEELAGLSFGVQGSAGVAVGYIRTPSGFNMIQIRTQFSLSAEFTVSWTFDLNDIAQVDWNVTEANLQRLYAESPEILAEMISELAMAKSLGGAWADEFIENTLIRSPMSHAAVLRRAH